MNIIVLHHISEYQLQAFSSSLTVDDLLLNNCRIRVYPQMVYYFLPFWHFPNNLSLLSIAYLKKNNTEIIALFGKDVPLQHWPLTLSVQVTSFPSQHGDFAVLQMSKKISQHGSNAPSTPFLRLVPHRICIKGGLIAQSEFSPSLSVCGRHHSATWEAVLPWDNWCIGASCMHKSALSCMQFLYIILRSHRYLLSIHFLMWQTDFTIEIKTYIVIYPLLSLGESIQVKYLS